MVVFDFDGVISDSIGVCRSACQYAARKQNAEVELSLNPFRDLDQVSFENLATCLNLDCCIFTEDVNRYLLRRAAEIKFFEGMTGAVRLLAQMHRLFIVSATCREVVLSQLQEQNIAHFFDVVMGGDSEGSKADKITGLQRLYQKKAIVVGDCVSDIFAAYRAQALPIAVSWGWQSIERLKAAQPKMTVCSPGELIKVIAFLSRQAHENHTFD